jgi:nucleoside-diphosphate-sugar epimerase
MAGRGEPTTPAWADGTVSGSDPLAVVYVGDLCAAFFKAIVEGRSGRFTVAEPKARSMREFLQIVADRRGVRCRFVSIPSAPLLMALRLTESLHLRLPISSENVLGAKAPVFEPSAADLQSLGVNARGLEESLASVCPSGPPRD